MGAITTPIIGQSTALHMSTSALALSACTASNKVGEVQSIGDLSLTSNIIEVSQYGTDFNSKLRGKKASDNIEITLNWVPDANTQSEHGALKDAYEDGTQVNFAIIWQDDSAGTNQSGCTFTGFVEGLSISQPLEDVVTMNVTVNIIGGVTMDLDGTL